MARRVALFLPLVLAIAWTAPAQQDEWSGVERIVAVGDVHGDYDQFLTVLNQAGVVNSKGRWTGGKTHLVQTGDVPDRGPATRKILDLLMRLEREAAREGGYVHALIGNHEAMNIYGDLRYTTPEEFAAFRTRDSKRVRDAFFQQEIERLRRNRPPEGGPEFDRPFRKEWEEKHPLGYFEHRYQFGPKGKYGRWIRKHNTVIKLNDTLFVHGGLGPGFAARSLGWINETVRGELKDFSRLKEGIAIDPGGPLWYRGLAQGDEQELEGHVASLLAHYGVRRIVVGHTPTAGTVIPRFGGRVVLIDVGLSQAYGGRQACLLIDGGTAYTLHRGRKLKLPQDSGAGLLEYLKEAAALDPPPSPLDGLIRQLEAAAAASEPAWRGVGVTPATRARPLSVSRDSATF